MWSSTPPMSITGQSTFDERKDFFKKVYSTKKTEKEAEHRENSTFEDKLEQLKESYAAGLLTEEEFETKKGGGSLELLGVHASLLVLTPLFGRPMAVSS